MSPASVAAGSGDFNLTITGTGLAMGTRVNFGGAMLTPSSVTSASCAGSNCEALAVLVPGADVASAGTTMVSVANGSQISNSVAFTVTAALSNGSGAPQLLVFSPEVTRAGFPVALPLLIFAENVAPGATVNFGSLALTPNGVTTQPVPGGATLTSFQVQVPPSALVSAAEVAVTITNPGASGGTSNAGNFFIVSKSVFPIDESVSNANPALPGDGASTHSSMAESGLMVAFDSTATNLVAGVASGISQVYVRQNCFRVSPNCASPLSLVSVAPDGSPGAGGIKGSDKPVISVDGRFVVFESDDTNLVPGVSQGVEQIYLRDTCQSLANTTMPPGASCTPKTVVVSASATGEPGNAASTNPSIGVSGFLVAFQSAATNLVSQAAPAGVQQIYLQLGCDGLPTSVCSTNTVLLSVDASGNAGNKDSTNPAMDKIGLVVAFQSLADNIVANLPGNSFEQVYLRATCVALPVVSGATCPNAAEAASVDANGKLGTADSITPVVGILGTTTTVFATRAPNLLPANTSSQQIVATTTCLITTTVPCLPGPPGIISVDQNGLPGQGDSSNPALGVHLAFASQASLLAGISGQQVYATDSICTSFAGFSCAPSLVLVSADSGGKPMGGDHAVVDIEGAFATFSGGTSGGGAAQVFLAAPFL